MRIGIDIDGVLADFNSAFIPLIIDVTGKDLFPPRPFDIPTWHYPQHFGYTDAEMDFKKGPVWSAIRNNPEFWYTLPAYDGAQEFLRKLDIGYHDIYFITSRTGVNVKMQTEAWLEYNNFGLHTPNFGFPTVLISDYKGAAAKALNLDLYIDDRTSNALDVNHESPTTKVIIMNRPWNIADVNTLPRVDTLQQFEKFIDPL